MKSFVQRHADVVTTLLITSILVALSTTSIMRALKATYDGCPHNLADAKSLNQLSTCTDVSSAYAIAQTTSLVALVIMTCLLFAFAVVLYGWVVGPGAIPVHELTEETDPELDG